MSSSRPITSDHSDPRHNALASVARNINQRRKDIKILNRELKIILANAITNAILTTPLADTGPTREDEIKAKIESIEKEITELLDLYVSNNDGKRYTTPVDVLVADFFDDYFYELDLSTRNEDSLKSFYSPTCEFVLHGCPYRFKDQVPVVQTILNMFEGLKLEHAFEKVTIDGDPPKRCDVYVTIKTFCKIDNDTPRKITEIFEMKVNEEKGTQKYPYLIARHTFINVDARPLYHWPELPQVPKTEYDNWEPQFKPVYTEEQLAMIAAAKAAAEGKETQGDADTATGTADSDDEDRSPDGTKTGPGTIASNEEVEEVGEEVGDDAKAQPTTDEEAPDIIADEEAAGDADAVNGDGTALVTGGEDQ